MRVSDGWAERDGQTLHFLISHTREITDRLPFVFLPGAIGNGRQYRPFMEAMSTRRTVALDLRGRGQSSAPSSGYTFQAHVLDLRTLLDAIPFGQYCLYAHSMSVPIAIRCAAQMEDPPNSLVLGDYPPVYPSLDESWATTRMRDYPHLAEAHVIRAVQAESAEVNCWADLESLDCPILYQVAGNTSKFLTEDDVNRLKGLASHIRVQILENSDHRLWFPDPEDYVRGLEKFVDGIS